MVFVIMFFVANVGFSKTLFLDKFDMGEVLVSKGFLTSISFERDIKTVFLGDKSSFSLEVSQSKRILGVWSIGKEESTNLMVLTEQGQYNFEIKKREKSPLFYFIKEKSPVSKNEIIERSKVKDRDLIENFREYKSHKDFILKLHDREVFKDTLYQNIRIKVSFQGNEKIKILHEQIVLSQNDRVMQIVFMDFDKKRGVISITGEERIVGEKIYVQIPYQIGEKIWVSRIII